MVVSILDSEINYFENKKLENNDRLYNAPIFSLEYEGEPITIGVGNYKTHFINDKIIFFPIYLIIDDNVDTQIGLYEANSSDLSIIIDEEGDIDISRLGEPLFYQFTKKKIDSLGNFPKSNIVSELGSDTESESGSESGSESESDTESNETLEENTPLFLFDKINIKEENYKEGHIWIQNYLKNNSFSINFESETSCIYKIVCMAFASVGKKVNETFIKEKISNKIDFSTYTLFKTQFDILNSKYNEENNKLKEIKNLYEKLKDDMKQTTTRTQHKEYIEKGEKLLKKFEKYKKNRQSILVLLKDWDFMKRIENENQFKDKIKSCDFWNNKWMLQILERVLSCKFIIFQQNMYSNNNFDEVLYCNPIVFTQEFKPSFYIMINDSNNKYQIILYKNTSIFNYNQLPNEVKKCITDKCVESNTSVFSLIPEFRSISTSEEVSTSLYNSNIIFQLYERSYDKPYPGKGSGEKIPEKDELEFIELSQIKDWRRRLFDFWQKKEFNEEFKEILVKTKDALLNEYRIGKSPIKMEELMKMREKIIKTDLY